MDAPGSARAGGGGGGGGIEVEVVPRKYVTPKEIAVRMMKWCVCGFEKMKERRY